MKRSFHRVPPAIAGRLQASMHDSSSASWSLPISRSWVLGLITIAAVALWASSLPTIEPRRMTDLGLVSVLPVTFFMSLAMLALSFVLALHRRPLPRLMLAITTIALVVILYGTFPLVAERLPFSTAWIHAGFADVIGRTGELYQNRDARFSWPAFFAFAAYLTDVGGFDSPVEFAAWSPVVLNLLLFVPLFLLFGSSTTNPRLVWLAVWMFFSVNWVGQDYFSPQGFSFLLFVTFFSILLTAFRSTNQRPRWLEWIQDRLERSLSAEPSIADAEAISAAPLLSGRARAGLVVIAVLLYVTVTAGHQLTPFAALGGAIALLLFGRTTARGLPLIMLVILSTWLSYMTVTFLAGHLGGLLADLGRTENVATSNIANRIRGSVEHQLVVYARLGFAVLVWLLAFVGGLRRLFERRVELTIGLLALAPFGLLALQSYGGEMLLRVFLFSSPFMAYLAAAAFVPSRNPLTMSWVRSTAVLVVSVLLIGTLLLTRYGNASADYMSPAEVAAAEYLYRVAEPQSLLATVNHNAPLQHRRWEEFRYTTLRDEVLTGDVDDVIAALRGSDAVEAYLFMSRSQRAFAQLFLGTPQETWRQILADLSAAPALEVVFENEDALVLRLRDDDGTARP